MRFRIATIFLLALLGVPLTRAASQTGAPRVQLTPYVGWYSSVDDLRQVPDGTVNPDGTPGAAWTRLKPGPAVGLLAEIRSPLSFVGLRGNLLYVSSDLSILRHTGFKSCGEHCREFTYTHDPIASSSLVALTGDLVLRMPRIWRVQPYVLTGGGIKHYNFAQSKLSGEFATAYERDVTDPTLHLGLGTDWRLGRYGVVAEISNYFSMFDVQPGEPANTEHMQSDITYTLGVRVPLF